MGEICQKQQQPASQYRLKMGRLICLSCCMCRIPPYYKECCSISPSMAISPAEKMTWGVRGLITICNLGVRPFYSIVASAEIIATFPS